MAQRLEDAPYTTYTGGNPAAVFPMAQGVRLEVSEPLEHPALPLGFIAGLTCLLPSHRKGRSSQGKALPTKHTGFFPSSHQGAVS